MEDNVVDLHYCFGCGQDNPIGLRLKYSYIGERSHIEFDVKPEHCGYPRLMHGGLTCVLFDEAMYHAIAKNSMDAVTLTMAVDYTNPALEGQHLICEGWIEKRDKRKIYVISTLIDDKTKKLIARARATYLEVDLQKMLDR